MTHARLALCATLAALLGFPARGATIQRDVPGARSGIIVVAPDRTRLAERVSFDSGTAARLAAAAPEETLTVSDWPVAPGLRARVTLTRHDVYTPDAHVYRVDGDRLVDLPRSPLLFFWGPLEGEPGARTVVSLDPETLTLGGETQSRWGSYVLQLEGGRERSYLVAPAGALSPTGAPLAWACGQEQLPPAAAARPTPEASSEAVSVSPAVATAATWQAVVAIDTDNEFMLQKFGNNTATATSYIASLFASMTLMYERDLGVRLVQGTTFLRVSTTPDPYSAGPDGGGNASGAELTEFGNYWSANYASVPRALAAMLSGKQTNPNSASGIGWVGGLCSGSYGYSFTQVFLFQQQTATYDSAVSGHEIGHNFGSPHTHCYTPPIDQCWNQEGGCYSGTTTSCPAQGTYNGVTATGTMMSYCNMLGGCSVSMVFHPTVVSYLQSFINSARTAGCITPISAPATATKLYTLPPCRVLDTRGVSGTYGGPAIAAGATRGFPLNAQCGIPSTAVSVSLNVTAVAPLAAGYFTLFPGGASVPGTSTINFRAGQVRANNAIVAVSSDGTATLSILNGSGAPANVLVDVNGYFK